MSLVTKKFIGDNQVGAAKVLLENEQPLRASAENGADVVPIMKVTTDNEVKFVTHPKSDATPTADNDLATMGAARKLGTPTDGDFTDGLLGFTADTKIADAIDMTNELFKYLAPQQGYMLSSLDGSPDFTISGTSFSSTPKIVGSTSNPLAGVVYESSDANGGSRTDFINDRVFTVTTPDISSWGWRQADKGTFTFLVNGTSFGAVNLESNFNESLRESGQTSTPWTSDKLAITSVGPTNSFPLWQDGTAQGTLDASNIQEGYNYIEMDHNVAGSIKTYPRKCWYSPITAPTVSNVDLGATGAGVNQPNSGATTRWLSGVRFYNAGTFNAIACDVNGVYGSTYPATDLTITSAALSTASVSTPLPVVSGGVVTNSVHAVSGQSMAIQASRRVLRGSTLGFTFQSSTNYGTAGGSATASLPNILIDSYPASSTATREYFDDENRRFKSDTDFNSTSLTPNWDSSASLVSGAGYGDGLQVYGGALKYPSEGFSSISAPEAGPNYSGLTGRRYYVREFRPASGGYQNFSLKLYGVNASALSNLSGSGIQVEMALPTQTTDGTTFEFKDCLVAYTEDAAKGCVDGALPSGADPQWNITAGTKSTALSGNCVLIRVSYPAGSSAQITQMDFNFNS
jgi:hypothetical protein